MLICERNRQGSKPGYGNKKPRLRPDLTVKLMTVLQGYKERAEYTSTN